MALYPDTDSLLLWVVELVRNLYICVEIRRTANAIVDSFPQIGSMSILRHASLANVAYSNAQATNQIVDVLLRGIISYSRCIDPASRKLSMLRYTSNP